MRPKKVDIIPTNVNSYIFTPLDYFNAGDDLRMTGEMEEVKDAETLYAAFVKYCEFMQTQYYVKSFYGRTGTYNETRISVPMCLGSFLMFSNITLQQLRLWQMTDDMRDVLDFIGMCIDTQNFEGIMSGMYKPILKKELLNQITQLQVEVNKPKEITGLEVL